MAEGRVVQVGPPRAIYDAPADAFVAGFVGAANLWTASVLERHGATVRLGLDGGLLLDAHASDAPAAPGDRRTVCLRPEAVQVLLPEVPAGPNRLPGTVRAVVFRGENVLYEISLDGGLTLHASVANPKGRRLFSRGETVLASCSPTDLFLLPPTPSSPVPDTKKRPSP
jgi:spermidine/putrescine transport system ATP-binding protein